MCRLITELSFNLAETQSRGQRLRKSCHQVFFDADILNQTRKFRFFKIGYMVNYW